MPRAATINSSANPLVKDVRRAIERRGLTSQGWCVAETFHLLEEALRDAGVRHVLAAESARAHAEARLRAYPGVPLAVLPDRLFQTISATETSQGVVALVDLPARECFGLPAFVVVLDGLQDPGNAGAIVRAAEAFGATGAVFVKGTVSPYNPKTLRASAGSLFRVPFLHAIDPAEVRDALDRHGIARYAAVPPRPGSPARPLSGIDLTGDCALIIGSEARGVSPALADGAAAISIPTSGVESLNAAVACAILLYEARRQRSAKKGSDPFFFEVHP
jgi:TrmH family RNA methyltransferase